MKKKWLAVFTAALMIALAVGVTTVFAAAESEEPSAPQNLVRELAAGERLDGYQVDGKDHLPYPDDWGIKSGLVADAITSVDNSGAEKLPNSVYFASQMPLQAVLTAEVTDYTASATVTGKEMSDYGGFGILFGWYNAAPVVVSLLENDAVMLAIDGNEFAQSLTPDLSGGGADLSIPSFALDTEYTIEVRVKDGAATVTVNDVAMQAIDLSDKKIVPAVGPAMKNYRAEFVGFSLTAEGVSVQPEEPIEWLTPADYAQEENLLAQTVGLIDTYGAVEEFKTQQPFPGDWGMKVAAIDGKYMRVNNKYAPYINDSFTASFLPTAKDVSAVSAYYAEGTVTPTERSNWGGAGIVFGRSLESGAPLFLWVTEIGQVQITKNFSEWGMQVTQLSEGQNPFAIGKAMKLGVVVIRGHAAVYVNDELLGIKDISDAQAVPMLGVAYKNYNAEITDLSLRTKEKDLAAAQYTVTCISGSVEIGSIAYTYGAATELAAIERPGNDFMGWHLLPDLSDETITRIEANVGGDINVYCEYKTTVYTIAYYDGDTPLSGSDYLVNYNYKSYVPLPTPKKEGYTFDGWYENADFSGEAVIAIEMGTMGDKVFYAKFTPAADGKDKKGCGCDSSIGGITATVAGAAVLLLCGVLLLVKRRAR